MKRPDGIRSVYERTKYTLHLIYHLRKLKRKGDYCLPEKFASGRKRRKKKANPEREIKMLSLPLITLITLIALIVLASLAPSLKAAKTDCEVLHDGFPAIPATV
jgi:hypothetical protein